ncbi:MAG: biopolymer transporter ExbD [Candidatus Brocadiia bacterium]
MAKPKIRGDTSEASMEINMTPMIDVIFQLIIFFMCSIHFKSLEGKLYSYLPKDKGMAETTVTDPELDEVRILLIYDKNKLPLQTMIKIGLREIKDWNALSDELKTIYTQQKSSGAKIPPYKIDSDFKVPVQAVINALNTCKKVGIATVEFAAKSTDKTK